MRKPTINDVAALAGVSNATASRAISKPEAVSPKTLAKVEQAISEIGYVKNLLASSLRRDRAGAILVLVPSIENTFFLTVLSGIERVAADAKLSVLIGSSRDEEQIENELLEYVHGGRADGAILLTGRLSVALVKNAQRPNHRPLKIVTASGTISQRLFPHIGIDDVGATQGGVEYLVSLGHKNITHLSGPNNSSVTRGRCEGYEKSMLAAGLQAYAKTLGGDFTIESGVRAALEIIAMTTRPTAVFCANDEMAIGAITTFLEHGVRVPEDISVMGFDDIQFAAHSVPPLTTIRQPRLQLGEQAMLALIDVLANEGPADPTVTLLETELIIRKSTAPPR
ncbi:MAG: LacI family DNA-binding transcriptional regulator [Rhodobacteraceae bacterium]|nr:LacI family DNA-binding transcriptional regulator [Paracoccaceae bacterium]